MDEDLFAERLKTIDVITERLVEQTATINDMASRMTATYEVILKSEQDRTKELVEFLERMRSTYDTHIQSIEQSRNRAVQALLAEQQLTLRLLDRLSAACGISISGVGNVTKQ